MLGLNRWRRRWRHLSAQEASMMYARSTTITAQISALDEGVSYLREQTMPALLEIEGCVGLSLLVDRESGRCIATSSWESEQAMHASEAQVGPIRTDASGRFGGSVDRVDEWEIAVLHREHAAADGACVRCTWLHAPMDAIEQAIDVFKTDVLPQVEQMDGFCSASLFVDRATGRAVSATAWDSRAAMEASRERANQLRTSTADRIRAQIVDVIEFDLAVAHLRVPEMA
jgi:quinol monooxygenase YgiN